MISWFGNCTIEQLRKANDMKNYEKFYMLLGEAVAKSALHKIEDAAYAASHAASEAAQDIRESHERKLMEAGMSRSDAHTEVVRHNQEFLDACDRVNKLLTEAYRKANDEAESNLNLRGIAVRIGEEGDRVFAAALFKALDHHKAEDFLRDAENAEAFWGS